MSSDKSYSKAFLIAVFLHVFLALMLLVESTLKRPVLVKDTITVLGQLTPQDLEKPKQEIVKAVSVNNEEVMAAMHRLKQERDLKEKVELDRQLTLKKQAEAARKERLQEQQRLARLKEEAAKLALAKKKVIAQEQKRIKELALQREQEAKRLEELKTKQKLLEQKQQEEAERIAETKKKQEKEAKAQADKLEVEARAEKARIAGEVDKYKAMIINAISRQWILPDNVDNTLSSQFRIRLAPNGAVLEVNLTRSSGDSVLDRSAQTAIYKASPLPVPTDPTTFDLFRDISLTVRPENIRG